MSALVLLTAGGAAIVVWLIFPTVAPVHALPSRFRGFLRLLATGVVGFMAGAVIYWHDVERAKEVVARPSAPTSRQRETTQSPSLSNAPSALKPAPPKGAAETPGTAPWP